jgi:hypothetical protein
MSAEKSGVWLDKTERKLRFPTGMKNVLNGFLRSVYLHIVIDGMRVCVSNPPEIDSLNLYSREHRMT